MSNFQFFWQKELCILTLFWYSNKVIFQIQNKCFDYLDAPIEKLNTADTPAPYSPVLLAEWLPNQSDVIKSVKKVLYQK